MPQKHSSLCGGSLYVLRFQSDQLHQAMIQVVIVLLLLTALVATEPSSPGGDSG